MVYVRQAAAPKFCSCVCARGQVSQAFCCLFLIYADTYSTSSVPMCCIGPTQSGVSRAAPPFGHGQCGSARVPPKR